MEIEAGGAHVKSGIFKKTQHALLLFFVAHIAKERLSAYECNACIFVLQ